MASILKSRMYGIIIALSVLSIIIAVGYVLGQQANKDREIKIEVGAKAKKPVDNLFDEAQKLRTHGKEAEALAVFQKILAKHPNIEETPMILYYMGSCYRDLGKVDDAIAQYKKIISDRPNFKKMSAVLLALGVAYEHSNDYPNALTTYQQIINRWPQTEVAAQAGQLRGRHFFLQKKYKEAILEFSKVANYQKLKSKFWKSQAMDMIADSYSRLGQYDKAVQTLNERISKFGSTTQTQLRLANAYYHLGRYTEAKDVAVKLLEVNPKYHNASTVRKLID